MVIKTKVKLTKIEKISPSVNHFTFESFEEIKFEAGQFINLTYNSEDKKIKRAYSIANAYEEANPKNIELCIKLVEEGELTPKLFQANINDEFDIMGPLGLFKLRNVEEQKNQVFIAAGTGVAPMRSFIKELLENLNYTKEITLLLGIRYETEILYEKEFKELENRFNNFKFIPIISRPSENWKNEVGYVQQHIDKIKEIENSEYYICGLNKMVDECVEKLTSLNVQKENLKFEKYG